VLVANLVSERGECAGLDLADHLRLVEEHAGGPVVDAVLVHDGAVDAGTLDRYRAEGATPLAWTGPDPLRPRVLRRGLRADGKKLRHDPGATAQGLIEAWREISIRHREVGEGSR